MNKRLVPTKLQYLTIILLIIVLSLASLPARATGRISAPADLLQFTAGGHALGFSPGGMYAATGSHALHVEFAGANAVRPQSDSPAGTDGKAASLNRVTYADLWDGITLTYTAEGGNIYTTSYMLAPGADPAYIRLRYNAPLSLNGDGSLGIAFETGSMTESAPVAWQDIGDQRVPVEVSWRVRGQEAGFRLGSYDQRHALAIDPDLTWNTFLGGNGSDVGDDIAVDGSGNIYVTGHSSASWGSPLRAYTGGNDAFVAKLTSSGALVWNTFLGGSGYDAGYGIAVDGSGNLHLTGESSATWGSPIRRFYAGIDAFVARLNSSSGTLIWNTFLGGSEWDWGEDIAVDGSGNVYVTGRSDWNWGENNPVRAYTGYADVFVARLTSSGGLTWNTFLGGSSTDIADDIAVDGSGNVYVTGESLDNWGCSPTACTVRPYTSNYDAFAVRLNPSGVLTWNSFLGGSQDDSGRGITLDGSGNIYVIGDSFSTWGSPLRAHDGMGDAFVARLTSSGGLTWNTFLGGSGYDIGFSIAVDSSRNMYVTGLSQATWGSPLRAYTGSHDAFAAMLTSSGALTWNTFLGGSGIDVGNDIAVDGSGNVYVTGESDATWGSPVRAYTGDYDAFVAKLNTFTLNVIKDGTGSGTVVSDQSEIDCGSTCSYDFAYNTVVTLDAFADTGSTFTGWSGSGCSGKGSCVVTMTTARSVTATFSSFCPTVSGLVRAYDGIDCSGASVEKNSPGLWDLAGIFNDRVESIAIPGGWSARLYQHAFEEINESACFNSTDTDLNNNIFANGVTVGNQATWIRVYNLPDCLGPYTLSVIKNGTGSGTISSDPSGINCGSTCSASFDYNTNVTLYAYAATGSTFTGWSSEGCYGTSTCTVAMTAARSVTAFFTLNTYSLSVNKSGTGSGWVTSDPAGIDCGLICNASSTSFNYNTSVTLTATASTDSTFTGWSGGGCSGTGTCTVTMDTSKSVWATFMKNPSLFIYNNGLGSGTVSSNPAGINCGSTCSAYFNYNTSVTLTATASTGSTFTGWSGGGCTGMGTCTITMDADNTVTATFALNTYILNVSKDGSGSGTISSNPSGIYCGSTCLWYFDYNTSVTLTATASTGSTFTGWSGGGCSGTGTCTVTMDAAKSVTATFALNTYSLSVNKSGTGSGTVSSNPAGINCGSTCSAYFNYNTSVTLTATASTGSTFTGWSGGGCTGMGTCTITMDAAKSVTATFALNTYSLSVNRSGTGSGWVTSYPVGIDCGSTCLWYFDHNTSVTLTATAYTGSTFTGWSGGGCSGTGTCTVTMDAAKSVTATFALNTYSLSVNKSGTGSGTVSSYPSGIYCGSNCSAYFDYNTGVTLTASAGTGFTFGGWSGGGCSGTSTCNVTMTAASSVNAVFITPGNQILTVSKFGSGSGTITSDPAGINCGLSCSYDFAKDTVVTLTATAAKGSKFSGWYNIGCSGIETCTVTMSAAISVGVLFNRDTSYVYLPQVLLGNFGPKLSTISDPAGDWLPDSIQLPSTDILSAAVEHHPAEGVIIFTMELAGDLPLTLPAEERNRWIWLLDTDKNASTGIPWYVIGAEYEINLHIQWDDFYVDVHDWNDNWTPVPGAGTIDGNTITVRIPVSYLGGASRFNWMAVVEPFDRAGNRFDIAPDSGFAQLP